MKRMNNKPVFKAYKHASMIVCNTLIVTTSLIIYSHLSFAGLPNHQPITHLTGKFSRDHGFLVGSHAIENDADHDVYVPKLKPGYEFTASALFLQPSAGNLGWSAITTVLPIPTPEWQVKSFNPSFKTGFNLGARYVFERNATDLQASWSYLNANYKNAVHVDPSSQWVSPFSQTGTLPENGEITGVAALKNAYASLNFNYNSINLDLGKFVNFGSNLQTRFFTGLVSLFLTEKLVSSYDGSPRVYFSLNNKSTYAGVGPRLGFSNDFDVSHGVHLVGQLAGSILVGSMNPAQYQFAGSSAALDLVDIALNTEHVSSSRVTQVVPSVDAKIGLSYSYLFQKNHEMALEIGYMGAVYINPLTAYETSTNVIALDTGSLSTSSIKYVQSNFSVAGPYLTVHYKC